MLKIANELGDVRVYLVCDHCGQPVHFGDLCAFQVNAAGEPTNGKALTLHATCCRYATGEGAWQYAPIKTVVVDIAAGLRAMPPEMRQRERRQRLIIKYAAAAGKKGITPREVQRQGRGLNADEVRDHMEDLVKYGILTAQEAKNPRGRTIRRYYAALLALETLTLTRL